VSSLDDYISRMPSQQKHIHYLCMPSRAVAEASPYFEQFKAQNIEVCPVTLEFDVLRCDSIASHITVNMNRVMYR
jgi:HSP90 family molecular chaperone